MPWPYEVSEWAVATLRAAREEHDIVDEGKVARIVVDWKMWSGEVAAKR